MKRNKMMMRLMIRKLHFNTFSFTSVCSKADQEDSLVLPSGVPTGGVGCHAPKYFLNCKKLAQKLGHKQESGHSVFRA